MSTCCRSSRSKIEQRQFAAEAEKVPARHQETAGWNAPNRAGHEAQGDADSPPELPIADGVSEWTAVGQDRERAENGGRADGARC